MARGEIPFIKSLAKDLKHDNNIDLHLNGTLPQEENDSPFWLNQVITELVTNSVAVIDSKPSRRIDVTVGTNFLIVDDGTEQPDVQLSLNYINRARQAEHGGRDLSSHQDRPGGTGIQKAKRHLIEHGGDLRYQQVGNKIVAIATFEPVAQKRSLPIAA